jgi:hypothetical protein
VHVPTPWRRDRRAFAFNQAGFFAPVAIENITMQSNAMRAVLFLTQLASAFSKVPITKRWIASMQDLGSRGYAGFPAPMPFF